MLGKIPVAKILVKKYWCIAPFQIFFFGWNRWGGGKTPLTFPTFPMQRWSFNLISSARAAAPFMLTPRSRRVARRSTPGADK